MQELRLGVCGCTESYHDVFNNAVISIPVFGTTSNLTLKVRGVSIPEHNQQEALLRKRCHLFLDHHTFLYTQEVSLSLEDYVPHSRKKCEVAFCGWNLSHKWDLELGGSLPTGKEILQAAESILCGMNPYDFFGWLLHLNRWWSLSDPRPKECRVESWRVFVSHARRERENRLREYHCYPSCTSECHA